MWPDQTILFSSHCLLCRYGVVFNLGQGISFPLLFHLSKFTKMLSRFALSQRHRLPDAARTAATVPKLFHTQGANHFPDNQPKDDSKRFAATYKKQQFANDFLENLLYGSKTIREIESQTHSKMLARGKYVHELQSKSDFYISYGNPNKNSICMQVHKVKPGKVDEYKELV